MSYGALLKGRNDTQQATYPGGPGWELVRTEYLYDGGGWVATVDPHGDTSPDGDPWGQWVGWQRFTSRVTRDGGAGCPCASARVIDVLARGGEAIVVGSAGAALSSPTGLDWDDSEAVAAGKL
jgi:hypothetical protein